MILWYFRFCRLKPSSMEVPKAVCDVLTEGDHGYLTVKGREFVAFVKDE